LSEAKTKGEAVGGTSMYITWYPLAHGTLDFFDYPVFKNIIFAPLFRPLFQNVLLPSEQKKKHRVVFLPDFKKSRFFFLTRSMPYSGYTPTGRLVRNYKANPSLRNTQLLNDRRIAQMYRKAARAKLMYPSFSTSGLNRRGQVNKESGYQDGIFGPLGLNTTGSVNILAIIAQGASVNERVGKKILWKSLQLRGYVQGDNTTLSCKGTMIIVYDERPTGSLPAVTDILASNSSNSMNNDTNSSRFRILMRRDYAIVGNTATAGQGTNSSLQVVDEYIKLRGRECEFMAAGTGSLGDISRGAIYIVTTGNLAAGTNDANLYITARSRFVDV
jgi:hypothetical protein